MKYRETNHCDLVYIYSYKKIDKPVQSYFVILCRAFSMYHIVQNEIGDRYITAEMYFL